MSLAPSIAGAVLHSLWQGLVVWAAVGLLDVTVARGRACVRHATRVVALGAWVLTFVVTAWPSARPIAAVAPAVGGFGLGGAVAWAWGLGVGCGLAHTLVGAWQLLVWRRRATPVDAWVQRLADELAAALRIGRVRVLEHGKIAGPCIVGVLAPVVMLPWGFAGQVDAAVLRAVLLHELQHVRRLDPWINVLVVAGRVLLFHHPVAWWIAAQIRAEREYVCDERTAAACGGALPYGRALLAVETWRGAPPLSVPTMAGPSLLGRLERLLGRPPRRPAARRRRVFALVVSSLVLLGMVVMAATDIRPIPPPRFVMLAALPPAVRRHEAQIVAAAARHHIDPRLLAIVVLVESGGDPRATSPVGARGLMQLMPATAADLARRRGEPAPSVDELYDPARSLDLGAEYLARQLHAFARGPVGPQREDVELAAAAYNAGPSRVRAWQRGQATLPTQTVRYRERVGVLWQQHLGH